ncbi:MAG: hypothetical protein DMG70_04985 [Acidobacteria bacterium]|nr:MAG: hypothetical protein DMG70_04985 [Acidobacteriota bacterium]
MGPSLDWKLIGVSILATNVELGVVYLAARWRARRPRRPAPPDIILPEGWQRWEPDGRGYIRLYAWRNHRWHELRGRRIPVTEELPE